MPIVDGKSIRTVPEPWVLANTQRPVWEASCLQPHSGRHGMSLNAALSRYGSAVELLASASLASDPCGTHGPRGELPWMSPGQ
jgi:hypothetical protein